MIRTLRRTALALLLSSTPLAAMAQTTSTVEVHADKAGPTYDRRIFTQFAEHLGNGIYGGLWVGKNSKIPNTNGFRNDVVEALKDLSVPVIRWPGGCFADEYHWREGVGPQKQRPVKINGTHEFFELLRQVGAEA